MNLLSSFPGRHAKSVCTKEATSGKTLHFIVLPTRKTFGNEQTTETLWPCGFRYIVWGPFGGERVDASKKSQMKKVRFETEGVAR